MKFTAQIDDEHSVVYEIETTTTYCPACGRPRSGPNKSQTMTLYRGDARVASEQWDGHGLGDWREPTAHARRWAGRWMP